MKFAGGTCQALAIKMIDDCKNSPKEINFIMAIIFYDELGMKMI